MTSTANASWHPAFMPNDASGRATTEAQISPSAETHDSPSAAPLHSQLAEDVEPTPPSQATQLEVQPKPEEQSSPWLAEDDSRDASDDWPVFERPVSDVPAVSEDDLKEVPASTAAVEPETTLLPSAEPADEIAPQPQAIADEPKPSAPTLGHTSTNSFTRTVSHEVNWDDDHDTEWTLSRTDTDPFKLMPPNERTNSFPPVPPASGVSTAVPGTEQPLPSNQAEDLIHEIESAPEHFDNGAFEETNHAANDFENGFDDEEPQDDQHYVGRDATFTEQEDLGSRYEEGVPLIPHSESNGEVPQPEQKLASFGDEVAGEDDFFSQIQSSNNEDFPDFGGNPTLGRKSTMQVMGDMNTTTLSRADTLGEMLEEDEDIDETTELTEEPAEPIQSEDAGAKPADDLAAKWEQAFADDDGEDFLLDESLDEAGESKPVDPSAFFGSDDEGFLDDDDDLPTAAVPAPAVQSAGQQNRYTPAVAPHQAAPSPYAPTAPAVPSPYHPQTAASPFAPAVTPYATQRTQSAAPYNAQQTRPEPVKAQSFAAQSKGGYTSPYDLPMEVVVPKKRVSTHQLPQSPSTGPSSGPPPRSSSMQAPTPPPPQRAATSSASPPTSSHSGQPPPAGKPVPMLRNKDSFFEELPMASKPRSASRQSYRVGSPALAGPPEPLQPQTQAQLAPSPLSPPMLSPPGMSRSLSGGIPHLVPGERVNPYAPQTTQQQVPGIPGNARYSPAPPSAPNTNGMHRPPSGSRYSPAPTAARPPVPAFHAATTPPTVLPHLPRTSSPLAHFEVSREAAATNGDHPQPDRRSSYTLEPRRVPSLPTTREVEEEEDSKTSYAAQPANGVPSESRYSPAPPMVARQTPPPSSHGPPMHATLSPSKRSTSSYLPQAAVHDSPPDNRYAPPPRSQTQSPGSSQGARPQSQPVPRPTSVHSPTSPRATRSFQPVTAPVSRPRGPSQTFNWVAPTDGRENDPLQRWKGAPIISWGVGGTMITSFPKNVPRYGMGQTAPMIIRSPGEVHVKHIKDTQPLEERLAKFPGPLRGKSKKKETIAWLSSGIDTLEKELPEVSFQPQLSHEHKRAVERLLLWKILRVFVEHDGVLEDTTAVDKDVRDVLAPGLDVNANEGTLGYGAGLGADALQESSSTQMKAEVVDSSTMDQIRKHLLVGDREKAVWEAADKRLWGHAMLISNTVSPDLYKQVAQEFVRKEVNYPGHANESIAALYKVLSGNFDDCVDELVPAHARAGFQLVNTTSASGSTKDATEGLNKWRETLGLVLSNRSTDDVRALNALGNLLSSYGRAEAAHICFLFARKATIFGGLDDPASNFVLVGADHKTQGEQFAKETEALLLSEVYEYGLSLAGGPTLTVGVPHLAAYKLQHAMTLAEYGLRDKALQYCEAIASSINAQTKRSNYHHPILETAVENLRTRLRQAPKEESSSWISKPSMNKVSDTVWSRFNKFVAGDENDGSAAGASGEGGAESGPFARLAGGTPTISRSPSVSNFEPIYGAGATSLPVGSPPAAAVPIPVTRAASRYAPGPSQTPLSSSYEPGAGYTSGPASVGRSSNEYSRSPYEPRTSMDSQPGYSNGGYMPQNATGPSQGYTPPMYGGGQDTAASAQGLSGAVQASPMQSPTKPAYQGYEPYGSQAPAVPSVEVQSQETVGNSQQSDNNLASPVYQPPSYGYEPPSMSSDKPQSQSAEPTDGGGYEPPAFQPYGYEPPSYNPEPEQDDEGESRPKPKSFMDDDDDIPGLKALKPQEKGKSEKDKENEEMFKKAAEEDAKRAAAQQQSKKGWGFGSWFGGKKEPSPDPQQGNKPVKANLGESSSFVYDPDLKRWVNKKGGAEATQAKTATPPPPKGASRSNTGTPPPPRTMTPPMGRASAPPGGPPGSALAHAASSESLGVPPGPRPPSMMRSVSNNSVGGPPSAPPSRPATSMSNASSIDDLISAAGPRKPGAKKAKKGGRYVDIMAK